eukprot:3147649-Rhodomonas_salina.2
MSSTIPGSGTSHVRAPDTAQQMHGRCYPSLQQTSGPKTMACVGFAGDKGSPGSSRNGVKICNRTAKA